MSNPITFQGIRESGCSSPWLRAAAADLLCRPVAEALPDVEILAAAVRHHYRTVTGQPPPASDAAAAAVILEALCAAHYWLDYGNAKQWEADPDPDASMRRTRAQVRMALQMLESVPAREAIIHVDEVAYSEAAAPDAVAPLPVASIDRGESPDMAALNAAREGCTYCDGTAEVCPFHSEEEAQS